MTSESRSSSDKSGTNRGEITPEMARQVADKVYALWLKDLRLENERHRLYTKKWLLRGKK